MKELIIYPLKILLLRLSVLIILLSYFSSAAQQISLRVGPTQGINISSPKYKLGFAETIWFTPNLYGGGFMEVGFGKHFAIQAEVNAEQFTFGWDYTSYRIYEKYSYINIPIVAKLKFKKISLYGGYQHGILNFGERKMKDIPTTDFSGGINQGALQFHYNWHEAHSMYSDKVAALIGGIEYGFTKRIGISLRYVSSLTDLTVSGNDSIFSNEDYLVNRYVMFGAFWSIGIINSNK